MTRLLGLLSIACILAWSSTASAATCTVSGSVTLQSEDTYYCDTAPAAGGSQSCTGWKAVNLDTIAVSMRYLRVMVRNASGAILGSTYTNGTGSYSVTFAAGGASCTGENVNLGLRYQRIHEADLNAASPRWRFRIANWDTDATSEDAFPLTLTGGTTPGNIAVLRSGDINVRRRANIYSTTDAMLTEVVTWTSNLAAQFASTDMSVGGVFRIRITDDPANTSCQRTGCADQAKWSVELAYPIHGDGGLLRHEVGHLVHFALHNRHYTSLCASDMLNGVDGRNPRGCDWGSHATFEGLPTFFAIRSVTTADTNAWHCSVNADNSGGDQTVCSGCRSAALGSAGRIVACGTNASNLAFRGIGDDFATTNAHCIQLQSQFGCACNALNTGTCGTWFIESQGWRNYLQILRFYWDILDASTDGGQDDSNMAMGGSGGMAEAFESIPCLSGSGSFGCPYHCNEHVGTSGCLPVDEADGLPPAGTPLSATRDAYNPFDHSNFFPRDQANERAINCLTGATD